MTPSELIGPTVPAWIRETVRRHEDAWPPATLAAGAALVLAAQLLLGVILWTSEPAVYYALP